MRNLAPRIDPDELDLEQLRLTLESPGYRMIAARLAEAHARELRKLATVESWENARFIQGSLAGLQMAADSPKVLLQEIKARSARKAQTANSAGGV